MRKTIQLGKHLKDGQKLLRVSWNSSFYQRQVDQKLKSIHQTEQVLKRSLEQKLCQEVARHSKPA